ncbi:MarR family winged helix-turn-helix transcriptional regulator [Microbacterium sp. SLBN-146]|uniref:MarR family winged helix-turn-helix transcriptional regulator n=1 Tax=Microbacterium sp. SLBN-146 TaxID=2768457 RepID=UPI00114FC22A|nr:MarR family transcriptional regulator [Microbacterium sp. SLBN-146]TQJ30106.1 DNA-binding MarR family transcriptional regulator [Microbacterium sp. SLBN-146]
MTDGSAVNTSYWYDDPEDVRATSLMEALRSYRAAEVAMRRRTRQSMDMGENELLVLRYLTRARRRGEQVTPVVLAKYLGITSASMTAVLDRLEKSGHVSRIPNPTDRRSVLIEPSDKTDEEIRRTLTEMHGRMMDVVRPMTAADRRVVLDFLDSMREAVDRIDE